MAETSTYLRSTSFVDRKQLELDALLDITKAINENTKEDSLYKIFMYTLRANLSIRQLALLVPEPQGPNHQHWETKASFGINERVLALLAESELVRVEAPTPIGPHSHNPEMCQGINCLIPIRHKQNPLALVAVGFDNGFEGETREEAIRFVQTLGNILMVAIENKKLVRKQIEQEAYQRELEVARKVQSHMFPKNLPFNEQIQVVAQYQPHKSVGGDYYDFVPIDRETFFFCIADVSGKGMPAALLMSNFQASLRTLLRHTWSLSGIVDELNNQVLANSGGERFITFFGGIFNLSTRELRFINAGHNPPLLCTRGGAELEFLEEGCTVLGIFDQLPEVEEGRRSLKEGFTLFTYTDGISELENEAGQQLSMEGLYQLVAQAPDHSPAGLNAYILEQLENYRGQTPIADDLTMLSLFVDQSVSVFQP